MNEEKTAEVCQTQTPASKGPTMEVKNVISALVKAQLKIKAPQKRGVNPVFKNKYATYDDIMEAVRLPLALEGLTLFHTTDPEAQFLITRLYHISGEYLENAFPMRVEKPNSQGVASANTYAKRQAVCNLLGLPGDDDDDANAACQEKAREKISAEQKEILEEYIGSDAALSARILSSYKVKTLADLDTKSFAPILGGLKKLHRVEPPKIG